MSFKSQNHTVSLHPIDNFQLVYKFTPPPRFFSIKISKNWGFNCIIYRLRSENPLNWTEKNRGGNANCWNLKLNADLKPRHPSQFPLLDPRRSAILSSGCEFYNENYPFCVVTACKNSKLQILI